MLQRCVLGSAFNCSTYEVGPINSLKSISVSLAGLAGKFLWNGFMLFTKFRKSKQFGGEAVPQNDLTGI
jgi:hypothetical protein